MSSIKKGLAARIQEKTGRDPKNAKPKIASGATPSTQLAAAPASPLNSSASAPTTPSYSFLPGPAPTQSRNLGAWGKGIDTIRQAVNLPAPPPPVKVNSVQSFKKGDIVDNLEMTSSDDEDDEWANL